MRRYFLGLGAGYSKKQRREMLLAHGTEADYFNLQNYIIKEYGARQVLITRNGRSAIAAGLKYYFGDDGGEVIVNGLTCHAVIQGVKGAGMTPVYADIDVDNLNFTAKSLKKVLTKKTRAIIVQNTLGNMAPIKEIEKFAKENKLVLIEDLAHCTGRKYADGREAGMVGKITVFSFGKDKTIDVVNGGAVAFRDSVAPLVNIPLMRPPMMEVIRARLYPTLGLICRGASYVRLDGILLRFLFFTRLIRKSADGEVDFKKRRLSYFQAKLALGQLKQRGKNSKKPIREFKLVKNRDKILKELQKMGYYLSGFWYERPVAPIRYYRFANFPEKKCPNAVFVASHIINLPTYYTERDLTPARRLIMISTVEGKK